MKYEKRDNMGVKNAKKNVQSKVTACVALIVNQVRSTKGASRTITRLEENSQPAIVEKTDGSGVATD
jgi:hypothetical protein